MGWRTLLPQVVWGEPMKTLKIGWSSSTRRGKVLDFLISGKSILKVIEKRGFDMVPRLGSALQPTDTSTRALLLLETDGDMPSGRVALYVCSECGGYGCGVVSVKISSDGSRFIWHNFVWETDYDDNVVPLEKLGPFEFDGNQYREAITTTLIEESN
jgi:hypothetical protein